MSTFNRLCREISKKVAILFMHAQEGSKGNRSGETGPWRVHVGLQGYWRALTPGVDPTSTDADATIVRPLWRKSGLILHVTSAGSALPQCCCGSVKLPLAPGSTHSRLPNWRSGPQASGSDKCTRYNCSHCVRTSRLWESISQMSPVTYSFAFFLGIALQTFLVGGCSPMSLAH